MGIKNVDILTRAECIIRKQILVTQSVGGLRVGYTEGNRNRNRNLNQKYKQKQAIRAEAIESTGRQTVDRIPSVVWCV